jgi:tetratricopeptide (TPR) repeat protein
MKMKHSIVMMAAAVTLTASVKAQTLEEGIKMYNYERYQTAKKTLEPLAGTNPLANYYLGLAELQLGNKDAARNTFLKQPNSYANTSGLIRVLFVEGKAEEGMKAATELAGKAKKKEWEQLKYAADAVTYTNGGDAQQAINWYKAALANYENLDMRISLADAYLKLPSGGGGEAMSNYEKVVEKDPKNSLAFSRIGKLWYDAKNYKLALENWEKAKESDPENPLPYRDLANAYTYVAKYDLAKKHIEEYVKLADPSPIVTEKYMDVLFLSKEYKNAAAKAQELINTKPETRFYGILAFSQYELKDSVNALKNARIYFEKQDATKNSPGDYRMFAKILLQNSLTSEADMYLQKAIDADTATNKLVPYRENGEALREGKEWLAASKWYDKIVNEMPASATVTDYFYTGFTKYFGRDYDNALKSFVAMTEKYPAEPSGHYWSGRAAAAKDNDATQGLAVPYYTKWLEMEVPSTYTRKPNDLMQAYQYMAIYNYNKKDKAKTMELVQKIEAIDPNNSTAKEIRKGLNMPAGK